MTKRVVVCKLLKSLHDRQAIGPQPSSLDLEESEEPFLRGVPNPIGGPQAWGPLSKGSHKAKPEGLGRTPIQSIHIFKK